MKSKLLPTIIAGLSLIAVPVAFGATYQGELAATYGEVDLEDSASDLSDFTLEGTYYFSQVDTANRPLAESAFLQKASSVYLNGAYSRYKENDSEFDSSEKTNVYGRQLGADFYIPNSIFYLGAGISEFKVKSEWRSDDITDRETLDWESQWYVKAGVTPVDGLLVWSEFYEDVDVSDHWNINAKYVMPIGASGQWINLEARYETTEDEGDDTQVFSVAGDYYLDSHLSVGGGVSHYTYDGEYYNDNENEYFVRANQYFTDNFAVNLKYADGDYESSWTLGATLRF
jgi:hypothetical protein